MSQETDRLFIKSNEGPAATGATRISGGSTAVGSDQGGIRSYNERVIIQTLRALGNASRAEIARATQLTAQTVAVITDRLMRDGLVLPKGRKYGGLGQPSKQLALNPDGAYAIGVKVGRRGIDIVAIDFVGDLALDYHSATTDPDP
ncbi:MAG: winged helix-turn-helix domain-containing protein, partial [Alphaproteobacteria bacterium]